MSFIIDSHRHVLNQGVDTTPTKTREEEILELNAEFNSLRINWHQPVLPSEGVYPPNKKSNYELRFERLEAALEIMEKQNKIMLRACDLVRGVPYNGALYKKNDEAELPELAQDSMTGSDISLDVKTPGETIDQNIGVNQGSSLNGIAKKKPGWIDSISKILLISYLFFTNTIYIFINYVTMTFAYNAKPSLHKSKCDLSSKESEVPDRSF